MSAKFVNAANPQWINCTIKGSDPFLHEKFQSARCNSCNKFFNWRKLLEKAMKYGSNFCYYKKAYCPHCNIEIFTGTSM